MAELRDDIDAARQRMATKLGSGGEVKRIEGHLWPGERVVQMAGGTFGGGQGLLILTGKRLIFLRHGVVRQTFEDFPLGQIASVQWTSGLLVGALTIYAAGNKADITSMNKNDGRSLADTIRATISGQTMPAGNESAATVGAVADPIVQLRELAELRDAGVLTPQEFDAKKAEILERM